MAKKEKKVYAPHERDFFEQKPKRIMAFSEKDYTELPDPVRDPIVSNNIADREFDYTYNDEEDIFNDNDYDDND